VEDVIRQDNRRSEKKPTSPMTLKDYVAASANPEYLVESDKTGKEAAHKPDALKSWRSNLDVSSDDKSSLTSFNASSEHDLKQL